MRLIEAVMILAWMVFTIVLLELFGVYMVFIIPAISISTMITLAILNKFMVVRKDALQDT